MEAYTVAMRSKPQNNFTVKMGVKSVEGGSNHISYYLTMQYEVSIMENQKTSKANKEV